MKIKQEQQEKDKESQLEQEQEEHFSNKYLPLCLTDPFPKQQELFQLLLNQFLHLAENKDNQSLRSWIQRVLDHGKILVVLNLLRAEEAEREIRNILNEGLKKPSQKNNKMLCKDFKTLRKFLFELENEADKPNSTTTLASLGEEKSLSLLDGSSCEFCQSVRKFYKNAKAHHFQDCLRKYDLTCREEFCSANPNPNFRLAHPESFIRTKLAANLQQLIGTRKNNKQKDGALEALNAEGGMLEGSGEND